MDSSVSNKFLTKEFQGFKFNSFLFIICLQPKLFGNGIPRHSFIYRYSITWIQNNDTNFANQNKLFKLK